jgi:hypothetical protein
VAQEVSRELRIVRRKREPEDLMLAELLLVCGMMLPGDPGTTPGGAGKWERAETLPPQAVGRLLGARVRVGMTEQQVGRILGKEDIALNNGARVVREWYYQLGLTIDYGAGKVIEVRYMK